MRIVTPGCLTLSTESYNHENVLNVLPVTTKLSYSRTTDNFDIWLPSIIRTSTGVQRWTLSGLSVGYPARE